MQGRMWCKINSVGEIEYLDWEYLELRAAMYRKRHEGGRSLTANLSEDMEGLVACFAIAIREQVLRSMTNVNKV